MSERVRVRYSQAHCHRIDRRRGRGRARESKERQRARERDERGEKEIKMMRTSPPFSDSDAELHERSANPDMCKYVSLF